MQGKARGHTQDDPHPLRKPLPMFSLGHPLHAIHVEELEILLSLVES